VLSVAMNVKDYYEKNLGKPSENYCEKSSENELTSPSIDYPINFL